MYKDKRRFFSNVCKAIVKDKLALLGGIIILIFLIAGVLAPYIAPHNPVEVDLSKCLLPSSMEYPFGTDQMGRCIFSRILYGTRITFVNSLTILTCILSIGTTLGLIAGYTGGRVDNLIMRLSDIASTFPSSLLALAVAGIKGPNIHSIMVVFIALWWAPFTRVIRGSVIQVKEKDFVKAAIASGSSRFSIITKHILLNSISPVIVLGTLKIASIIMHLASFSFIGLGVQPPLADWGVMLSDSRQYIGTQPQLIIWPSLCIMSVVFGLNMFGEGLNQALKSRSGKSLDKLQQGEDKIESEACIIS